jgi:hypothetical protein
VQHLRRETMRRIELSDEDVSAITKLLVEVATDRGENMGDENESFREDGLVAPEEPLKTLALRATDLRDLANGYCCVLNTLRAWLKAIQTA